METDYIIPTVEVDPDSLGKLDTKNLCREKDGYTVRIPSMNNPCQLQLWEVYFAAAVLVVQPHSKLIFAHVKALCEHQEPRFLCEALLKEHTSIGLVADMGQEISLYSFMEEYLNRKFDIAIHKNYLLKYTFDTLDDPFCGKKGVARVFLVSPYLQNFLLGSAFFEGQYAELLEAMRQYNLPVNDVLKDSGTKIGEFAETPWDHTRMYEDLSINLRKHGGWAISKGFKMATPKDQLVTRLTGASMEAILAGKVPSSPRARHDEDVEGGEDEEAAGRARGLQELATIEDNDEGSNTSSSHPSDFDVDPEHAKACPFGLTYCEAFVLLRGILAGQQKFGRSCTVVGSDSTRSSKDMHLIAAAVLVDLYVREQVEVCHWTLKSGEVAVPYTLTIKPGNHCLDHFLDRYTTHAESIFRDMRLPKQLGEHVIWGNLEARGYITNRRSTRLRRGCTGRSVVVWDFARPDFLLHLKEGYLLAARSVYDPNFYDALDGTAAMEEASDAAMFCLLLQALSDRCFVAVDAMSRVLNNACPPFCKGQLFPPVTMVHGAAVCLGLIDRGFRIGNCVSTDLAAEAAEFNEAVMRRMERKFFLSPKVWQSFDVDASGELTVDEFIEGMKNVDVYHEFKREKVPSDILQMILVDFAQKLFQEVDVNGDGTLTADELRAAFRHRRDEAEKHVAESRWVHRVVRKVQDQVGVSRRGDEAYADTRSQAENLKETERKQSILAETRKALEWDCEVDRVELLDEDVDVS